MSNMQKEISNKRLGNGVAGIYLFTFYILFKRQEGACDG